MDPWIDRLSEYLDGDLEPAEIAAIEQHLTACDRCRRTLSDLRQVVARAAGVRPVLPTADLWPEVERRVRAIRPSRRTVTFSLPQLAAAALLLVALSGGLMWVLRGPGDRTGTVTGGAVADRQRPATTLPVSLADQTYDQAVTDLQRAIEHERGRLDPNTVAIVEKNLQVIDAAIAQARRALQADPSNTYLNGHLADARRRKLALLRSVRMMTDPEG